MPESKDFKANLGFTLMEILVVLVIVSLTSAVLLLRSVHTSPTKSVERQVNHLHSYFTVVQEQAILQPGVFGVFISEHGYSVLELNTEENTWDITAKAKSSFWRPKQIAANIHLTLTVNSEPISIPHDFSQVAKPQIVFSPSGEISPFSLILHRDNSADVYRLSGNFAGALVIDKVKS